MTGLRGGKIQNWKKYFQNLYLIKDLYSECNKSKQLNYKMTNNLTIKRTKDLKNNKFPKKIYRWQIGTWREADYHFSLGRYK